eukprot:2386117-Rhodomonas_salina.3
MDILFRIVRSIDTATFNMLSSLFSASTSSSIISASPPGSAAADGVDALPPDMAVGVAAAEPPGVDIAHAKHSKGERERLPVRGTVCLGQA